jgi:hypothetical protein
MGSACVANKKNIPVNIFLNRKLENQEIGYWLVKLNLKIIHIKIILIVYRLLRNLKINLANSILKRKIKL